MPAPNAALYRRTFICRQCGRLRRGGGSTPAKKVPPPVCCDEAMKNLMHEQTVAATQLTLQQRVKWLNAGGGFVHRGGKRPWKAVMRPVGKESSQRRRR